MNKRIRELSKQAEDYAESKLKEGYAYDEIHFFYEKKFAELIIQECAELTLDHRNADYYQGWLDYRNEIRQHWGIEK
jgi:hypothetical protein